MNKRESGFSRDKHIDPIPENVPDSQVAMFFIQHIDNPCEVELPSGEIQKIREFYRREARKMLETMTNPDAKEALRLKIEEYEGEK